MTAPGAASSRRQVAVVVHRRRDEAALLAKRAAAWLGDRGHAVRLPAEDAAAVGLDEWAWPEDRLGDGLDLALSVGGDGTMLRAVDLVVTAGVPVLGVNVGHLGYLPECEPADVEAALARFLAGDYRIEERMTLEVGTGGKYPAVLALNEAWLERAVPGQTVNMRLCLDGAAFTTYAADGLIVSTPTGSTAYNLSVRGPILSPTLRATVVKPVSPHQLFDFALVLGEDTDIGVEILEGRTATLLVDGRRVGDLAPGDVVRCRASPHRARLVRFGEHDFHKILKAKFSLADR